MILVVGFSFYKWRYAVYTRITLTLAPSEKSALIRLAERELRDPRAQAAIIIRQDLERRGLLPIGQNAGQNEAPNDRNTQSR
jgi:hypothetical protein